MKDKALFGLKELEKIRQQLKRKQQTIAVAESVTSGLLQAALSQAELASEFFQGGITAYNLGQKYKHLGVEPIYADQCDCVSETVTATMALNVCTQFSSEWGIGVTGYATPVPESRNNVYALYAIAYKGKIVAKGKLMPGKWDAFELQVMYVNSILRVLARKLAR
jgi:nicotinamide-nucleotide amidase